MFSAFCFLFSGFRFERSRRCEQGYSDVIHRQNVEKSLAYVRSVNYGGIAAIGATFGLAP